MPPLKGAYGAHSLFGGKVPDHELGLNTVCISTPAHLSLIYVWDSPGYLIFRYAMVSKCLAVLAPTSVPPLSAPLKFQGAFDNFTYVLADSVSDTRWGEETVPYPLFVITAH